MQQIAEVYDLFCNPGRSNAQFRRRLAGWDRGPGRIPRAHHRAGADGERPGHRQIIERLSISDKAKQKGTGKWTSQDAMDLGDPIPTIDSAVGAREMSGLKDERVKAEAFAGPKVSNRVVYFD